MKPETWHLLPNRLLETILWNIDSLDYDPYEGTKAECIHGILCESISDINRKIIDAYWKALSEESFKALVESELVAADNLIQSLRKYIT